MAVIPEKGCVYAPFDGEVEMVYDTGHAIGLVREDGMEVLIHVGINTVELGGKYYTAKVSNGQKIKKEICCWSLIWMRLQRRDILW